MVESQDSFGYSHGLACGRGNEREELFDGEDSETLRLVRVDEVGECYNHVDVVNPLDSHEIDALGFEEVG